jgi:hypothetical protein
MLVLAEDGMLKADCMVPFRFLEEKSTAPRRLRPPHVGTAAMEGWHYI